MHLSLHLGAAASLLLAGLARGASCNNSTGPKPDEDGKYWISSEHLQLSFIEYGASIANLFIADRYGVIRDIVTGFDNASYFAEDTQHGHFGGVPGRYANRIKNGTFSLDGIEYHTDLNDNDGLDTLHGGSNGWDYRNFTVVAHTKSSITFSIVDPDGEQGFPGEVVSYVTYSVDGWNWDYKIIALATTKKTPIHLTSHTYFNLDGFANNETNLALNHTFHLPYGGLRVDVDNILIPTGDLKANTPGSVNDFWSKPKQIGADFGRAELVNNCGYGCTGYDNAWITSRGGIGPYDWRTEGPVASLSSDWSGIRLDVYSDQDAFQMYSCNFQDGTMALKKTQGINDNPDFPRTIPKYGCVVLEPEEWIDGINHPEWGRQDKQIFTPGGDPYVFQASYRFSVE